MGFGSGISVPKVGIAKPAMTSIPQGHMVGHFRQPHLSGFGSKMMPKFEDGGDVNVDIGPGQNGIAPSTGTQSAMGQMEMQRYQGMSSEQLQELAMRMGDSPQGTLVKKILQNKRMQGLATGGTPDMDESDPMGAPLPKSGLLHSAVAGRTDHLQVNAPAGSYVIPADIVSGEGQGNTLAGAKFILESLDKLTAPYGTAMPEKPRQRATIPHVSGGRHLAGGGGIHINPQHRGLLHENLHIPAGQKIPAKRLKSAEKNASPAEMKRITFAENAKKWHHADGGKTEVVPILGAGGEMLVSPEHVRAIGHGNLKLGHRVLDAWVVKRRKELVKELQKLPGPAK